jgi:hypothetical protein
MKQKPSSQQALLHREDLARRVNHAGNLLLTNVPMAMSGQSDQVRMAYAIITVGAAVLHVAVGAALWVVRVRLAA